MFVAVATAVGPLAGCKDLRNDAVIDGGRREALGDGRLDGGMPDQGPDTDAPDASNVPDGGPDLVLVMDAPADLSAEAGAAETASETTSAPGPGTWDDGLWDSAEWAP